MNNYLYIGLIVLLLYYFFKPDNSYVPSQEEIQNGYVDKTKTMNDYPYPQISRTFKRLSHGKPIIPLEEDKSLPQGDNLLKITRTDMNNVKQRMYLPDYYRKDILSGNTIGSEELRPFLTDEKKSEDSWTDKNVSEHPRFYNSDVKDELTSIGSFFDENNQYSDKTSINGDSLISDSCFKDKNNNIFCEDNTRLQLIPPKLISDSKNCKLLNTIGPYREDNKIDDTNEKCMNGGDFLNKIKPSFKNNEIYSSFDNNPLVVDINF
tara:strand:+ start:214 stop:1005 length:792 start_codon:yes stop_codon:yes gene_type:complete